MYNGLEIDMLSLGNSDCILATAWNGFACTRVLIDGGRADTVRDVRAFLRSQGITYIDHVVSTHPHDDHIGGLAELVSDPTLFFGTAWVHCPGLHVDISAVDRALTRTAALKESRRIREALASSAALLKAVEKRGVQVREPFAGAVVGFLTVCGPTVADYRELLTFFASTDTIQQIHRSVVLQEIAEAKLQMASVPSLLRSTLDVLTDTPQTSPENNSSVILGTLFNHCKYLFTADAGAQALAHAASLYDLSSCTWMQLTHHGSRRNISPALIGHFRPRQAYVSACGSDGKHPRRAVVNAFNKVGTEVYSTHYPSSVHLRHTNGVVPSRLGYTNAYALWSAPKQPLPVPPGDVERLFGRLFLRK